MIVRSIVEARNILYSDNPELILIVDYDEDRLKDFDSDFELAPTETRTGQKVYMMTGNSEHIDTKNLCSHSNIIP